LQIPSHQWPELVDVLRQSADIVIFDGPSALLSADAALLAPLVDGVVLVLNASSDTRAQITEAKERLERPTGARLLGAITVTEAPEHAALAAGERLAISVDGKGITISLGKPLAKKSLATKRPPELPGPSGHTMRPTERANQTPPSVGAYDERVIVTPPPSVIITPPVPVMNTAEGRSAVVAEEPASTIVSTPQMLLHTQQAAQDGLQERVVGYAAPLAPEPEIRTRSYISKGNGRRPRRS
jgi:hypothetical protein